MKQFCSGTSFKEGACNSSMTDRMTQGTLAHLGCRSNRGSVANMTNAEDINLTVERLEQRLHERYVIYSHSRVSRNYHCLKTRLSCKRKLYLASRSVVRAGKIRARCCIHHLTLDTSDAQNFCIISKPTSLQFKMSLCDCGM